MVGIRSTMSRRRGGQVLPPPASTGMCPPAARYLRRPLHPPRLLVLIQLRLALSLVCAAPRLLPRLLLALVPAHGQEVHSKRCRAFGVASLPPTAACCCSRRCHRHSRTQSAVAAWDISSSMCCMAECLLVSPGQQKALCRRPDCRRMTHAAPATPHPIERAFKLLPALN